jgi:hypothetical protein
MLFQFPRSEACVRVEGRHFRNFSQHAAGEIVYIIWGNGRHWSLPCFWVRFSIELPIYIQGIHKRMVQFQTLTRNVFLTLHGHNVHRQQRQLSKFFMCYQQFPSHSLLWSRGGSFQDGVAAGIGFLCAPFWGVRFCDYSAAWDSCTV